MKKKRSSSLSASALYTPAWRTRTFPYTKNLKKMLTLSTSCLDLLVFSYETRSLSAESTCDFMFDLWGY